MEKTIIINPEEEEKTNELLTPTKVNQKGKYLVNRDVLSHEVVIKRTGYVTRDKRLVCDLKKSNAKEFCIGVIQKLFPIVEWLPKYSVKKYFIGDILAGITVAVMHIPHGIAYGILAGLGPINGLYMAIFPVLVYLILGTSRHISIGTFAVVSMMTLKVVQTHATEDGVIPESDTKIYTNLDIATALTISVGIIHLLMSFFRLGMLSALLSEPVVSGFTTGAAIHVVTSLLKDVLGVSVTRHKGAFKVVKTVYELIEKTPNTNLVTVSFCLTVMILMIIMNEILKPWLKKKCRFPLPAELFAICGATLISKFMDINQLYGVKLVGDIPKGLPLPRIPPIELLPIVGPDAIAIAIVSYSIVMSLGLTFAKKHSYEIRSNQELFAMGIGNLVGGCFSCLPLACSLSRSLIQEQTGGATQIASLFSAILILMTLLWIGPFFSTSPRCALAAVIIVALKPMFMQVKDLKLFAQYGKLECLTWIFTFFCVVLIDIDIGLLIGICFSLLTLYIKGVKPHSAVLGILPGFDAIYVDLHSHHNAVEVVQTKIFRYYGSLNFATQTHFRKSLFEAIEVDSLKIRRPSFVAKKLNANEDDGSTPLNAFRSLVLDFSTLGHIDGAGCRTLSEITNEMRLIGVRIFIANPSDRVYEALMSNMALGGGPYEIFTTLHDAVLFASANAIA